MEYLPIGTLVNAAAVIVGAGAGLLLHRGFPERFRRILLTATGLFTLALGAKMALGYGNPLILVGSLFLGGLCGEALRLEERLERWAERLRTVGTRVSVSAVGPDVRTANDTGSTDARPDVRATADSLTAVPTGSRFSEGLITAFLIFCVGPMTILGALDEGLRGDHALLYTKSLLDLSTSFVLASSLGAGVLYSAIPLLVFQLGITLLGVAAGGLFTEDVTLALTAVGGVLIIGLGINLLELAKLRITNLLPALIFAVLLVELARRLGWG